MKKRDVKKLSTAKKPKSFPSGPDESEYKFRNLPEIEEKACLFYHNARESRLISEYTSRIKRVIAKAPSVHSDGKFRVESYVDEESLDAEGRKTGVVFLEGAPGSQSVRFPLPRHGNLEMFAEFVAVLAQIPEFPILSWQNLPPSEEKERIVSILSHDGPEEPPALMLREGPDHKTILDFEEDVTQEFPESVGWGAPVWGHFRLDLAASKEQVCELISAWMDSAREKRLVQPSDKGGRRKATRIRLNELGALILRFPRWSLTQQEATKRLGCYGHPTDYRRACESEIGFFKDYFASSDTELPIHYSKGFRGKEC